MASRVDDFGGPEAFNHSSVASAHAIMDTPASVDEAGGFALGRDPLADPRDVTRPHMANPCPDSYVTRGQMAAFLSRALGYTDDGGGDWFTDDDDSIFELHIDRLATADVTRGCNPPVNDMFCPNDFVTRGQMAAFLVRALEYIDDGGGNLFVGDDGNIFEASIDKLATAGVIRRCNPPVNDQFCPNSNVTRGQMAAFLHRALG